MTDPTGSTRMSGEDVTDREKRTGGVATTGTAQSPDTLPVVAPKSRPVRRELHWEN